MATIASLGVSVVARTEKFQRGMRSASKTVVHFSEAASKAASRVKTFGLALGSIAAGAAVLMLRRQMKLVDQLGQVSDRLGIATEKLAGLQFAAQIASIDIKKLELGMQRMTRRVAEASIGTGEAQGALKELGLDVKKLNNLAPDEKMFQIADAMSKVSNQADAVRLGFKLFDTEGVDLIRILRGGSDALREAFDEAERFGLALSRVDVAQVQQANQAFAKLSLLIQGTFQRIAVVLSPFLKVLIEKLVEWGVAGIDSGNAIVDVLEAIIGSVAKVVDAWDLLRQGIIMVRVEAIGFFSDVFKGAGSLAKQFGFGRVGFMSQIIGAGFEATSKSLEKELVKLQLAPSAADKVIEFFDDVRLQARKDAEDIAEKLGDFGAGLPDTKALQGATAGTRDTGFQQFSPSRNAVFGVQKTRAIQVRNPRQEAIMIEVLEAIRTLRQTNRGGFTGTTT